MGRRQRAEPRTSSEGLEQVTTLPTPRQRMRKTFRILREVIDAATAAALALRYSKADAASVQLEVAVFGRGLNALKAVRLLCENSHWEFASTAVRQLFELVLNMEQVDIAADRQKALGLYERYGLLQMLREEVLNLEYDEKTGRPVDAERLDQGRALLDTPMFEEFKKPNKDGPAAWQPSWSGKNTWQMAQASPMPMRVDQYRHVFSSWSEQTHGTPSVVLKSFLYGGDVAEVVARDEVHIAETVASAVTHFLELWALLPTVPAPTADEVRRWSEALLAEAKTYGARPTPETKAETQGRGR